MNFSPPRSTNSQGGGGRRQSMNNPFLFTALISIIILQIILSFRTIVVSNNNFSSSPCKNEEEEDALSGTHPARKKTIDDDDDICSGYDGVLRIRSGDEGAALGTVFFMYVVNQLLYAEMYNLLPWIHMDNTSKHVYDFTVHGYPLIPNQDLEEGTNNTITKDLIGFDVILGHIPTRQREEPKRINGYEQKEGEVYWLYVPKGPERLKDEKIETYYINGNGVWETYFQSVSPFSPKNHRTCKINIEEDKSNIMYNKETGKYYKTKKKKKKKNGSTLKLVEEIVINKPITKPLYEITYEQLVTGIHLDSAPGLGSVRAWTYGHFWDEEYAKTTTIQDWYRDMRRKAATIVRKYYHLQPWLERKVESNLKHNEKCTIGLHIRETDKVLSGGRSQIPLDAYLYEIRKIRNERNHHDDDNGIIYIATDSSTVLKKIYKSWPSYITDLIRTQGEDVYRSNTDEAVFMTQSSNHHRTNTEVLIDIYTMAKCSILIHGRSAVSEAVFYINPDIVGIDLDGNITQTIYEEITA